MLGRIGLVSAVLLALLAGAGVWLWNDRVDLDTLADRFAEPAPDDFVGVRATWLGVATILFDDGQTRLLSDGFFSRPSVWSVLRDAPVAPDTERIEAGLARAGIRDVSAIFAVHSHYDHALDVAEVAKRTGATVVGSASTANVALGGGLEPERVRTIAAGDTLRFGRFRVTFLESRHAPIADGGPPMPGEIDAPLEPPAAVGAYKEGGSYSILIAHPLGSALLQGSAGYLENALDGRSADVVFLGAGGLDRLGPAHTNLYWHEVVRRVMARRVIPIHFDDFFRDAYPETIAMPPRLMDDFEATLARFDTHAAKRGVRVELPPPWQPIALFPAPR